MTLPQARVVYGTYGHLNAAKDNVVLLPSHYMANFHGYEWLIGADRALDTSQLFLVATELFGNGHSSSPSNTPEPFHGPRFPVMTIRDNVEAVHQLLTEELKITHLRAIVGFSMGARAGVSMGGELSGLRGPDRRNVGHGEESIRTAWCGWKDRSPHSRPTPHSRMATTPPRPPRVWRRSRRCGRRGCIPRNGGAASCGASRRPRERRSSNVLHGFRTDFIPGADANDLILQMRTWERHDVGTTPGLRRRRGAALRSIKVPVLYMPSETDLYFPVGDARYEAAFIPGVTLTPIPSLWGHTAGAASNPADAKFLNEKIGAFLGTAPPGR